MPEWIISNLATIIICVLLTAAVAAIIIGMVKKRKSGGSACGCGCSGCPMSGSCHPEK